jgi:hypothetical protein
MVLVASSIKLSAEFKHTYQIRFIVNEAFDSNEEADLDVVVQMSWQQTTAHPQHTDRPKQAAKRKSGPATQVSRKQNQKITCEATRT